MSCKYVSQHILLSSHGTLWSVEKVTQALYSGVGGIGRLKRAKGERYRQKIIIIRWMEVVSDSDIDCYSDQRLSTPAQ